MSDVIQLESNVYQSFNRVKEDIKRLAHTNHKLYGALSRMNSENVALAKQVTELSRQVSKLSQMVASRSEKVIVLPTEKRIVKKTRLPLVKKPKIYFVGAKTGKTVFPSDSIQAQNIAPKNRVIFKSEHAYLDKGYKLAKIVI